MIIIIVMKLRDVRKIPKTGGKEEEDGDDDEDKRNRIGTNF